MKYRAVILPALLPAILLALCAQAHAEQVEFGEGHWSAASAPAKGTPAAQLAQIRQELANHRPKHALNLADKFIEKHPRDPGLEEAMYLRGQAEMDRGRYWQAYDYFEKQITRFGGGNFVRRATYREYDIAKAFLAGKKRLVWGFLPLPAQSEGLKILERVVARVSGTQLAAESLTTMGEYYFKHKKWNEAALTYDRYVEMFAGQYDTSWAEFTAALAHYRSFRGVPYEDTPLLESRQRFKAFVSKYSNNPRTDEALSYLTKIEDLLAEKDYRTGEFYGRIGRPRPAQYYYNFVARFYPDTPWAQAAANKSAQIKPTPPPGEGDVRESPGVEVMP